MPDNDYTTIIDKSLNNFKAVYSDIDVELSKNYFKYSENTDCFVGMLPISENIIKKSGGNKLW